MEAHEQIKLFEEFFGNHNRAKLVECVTKGTKSIKIDFNEVAMLDPDLAEQMLENPEDTITNAEIAAKHIEDIDTLHVRVVNLPNSSGIPLSSIRQQIGKFVKVEGVISKVGEIYNRPRSFRLECPACSRIISVLNLDRFAKTDYNKAKCGCGRKGKMRLLNIKSIQFRNIYLEEDHMDIGERQTPRSKLVFLEHDLVDDEIDRKTLVGHKVILNGWLEYYEIDPKKGTMDTYFLCNSVEFVERGWSQVNIPKQDIIKIKHISESKTFIKDMSQSIAPNIYGEDVVKHALLLQLAGSENVKDSKGFLEERGCLHIALVGDPGVGKTALAKRMQKFWPVYQFTSAITASGVGLVAAVNKDPIIGDYVLVAGVIPMCNKGVAAIDELEKMNKDELGHLNNAMNDLKVVVRKVVKGTFETDTAILATMNPTGRTFTDNVAIYEQIDLPADLIDRFDLIFPIKAMTDEASQKRVFDMNLGKRTCSEETCPIYEEEFVTKYFAYARKINPVIPKELHDALRDRVMNFTRNPHSETESRISNRVHNVILRLIHASARLHLHEKVTTDDINEAMDMLVYSYEKQGLLTRTGVLDYARVEHIDMDAINIIEAIKDTLGDMGAKANPVREHDVIESLRDNYEEDKIYEAFEKLSMRGDILKPKPGMVKLI